MKEILKTIGIKLLVNKKMLTLILTGIAGILGAVLSPETVTTIVDFIAELGGVTPG